ncbi:MAG TPA: FMN-binding protein [Thermoanaerobaculia bacterium]|nr:FMN-binding protein [Thermoanaerobaculia bacterium]
MLLALLFLAAAHPAAAKVFLSVDEALELAFPGCQVARRTAYLTPEQLARARAAAGVEVPSALVTSYAASCPAGEPGGTAYFDTHRVRTLPETVMIVVDAAGAVRRLEVLSFSEPEEYLPRGPWYGQFLGRRLDGDLQLKRAIRPVTGATLTARATTSAVRRVLALHQVIQSDAGRREVLP